MKWEFLFSAWAFFNGINKINMGAVLLLSFQNKEYAYDVDYYNSRLWAMQSDCEVPTSSAQLVL